METTVINLGQMLASGALPEPAADAQPGFAAVMELLQSGAPPGPPPPTEKEPEAGAAILEPNAETQVLDLLPKPDAEIAEPISLAGVGPQADSWNPFIPAPSLPGSVAASMSSAPVASLATRSVPAPVHPPIIPVAALEIRLPDGLASAGTAGSAPGTSTDLPETQLSGAQPEEATGSATLVKAAMTARNEVDPAQPQASRAVSAGSTARMPLVSPEVQNVLQIGSVEASPPASAMPTINRAELIPKVKEEGPGNLQASKAKAPETPAASVQLEGTDSDRLPFSREGSDDLKRSGRVPMKPAIDDDLAATIEAGPSGSPAVTKREAATSFPRLDIEETEFPFEAPTSDEFQLKPTEATLLRKEQGVSGPTIKDIEPLTRPQLSQVVRQIADRIEHLAAVRSTETVVVKLEPFDLGTITLNVRSSNSQVETRIAASNDQVRQALEQNGAQLSRALETKGLTLGQMSVGHQTSSQAHAEAQARQPAQHHSPRHPQMPAQQISIEAMRQVSRKATGVDLWI